MIKQGVGKAGYCCSEARRRLDCLEQRTRKTNASGNLVVLDLAARYMLLPHQSPPIEFS